MHNNEKIEILQKFNELISNYLDGIYEDKKKIKSDINRLTPIAQDIVSKASCLKLVTITPPPAVGGMVVENVNPFDMIFNDPYRISLIPDITDMVEQAIGKYENNLVKESPSKEKSINIVDYPNKITFQWLLNHVPMKIWFAGLAVLVSSFVLGVKFCGVFIK